MLALIDKRRSLTAEFNRAAYDSAEYRTAASEIASLEEQIEAKQAETDGLTEAQQRARRIQRRAMRTWIGLHVDSAFRARESIEGVKRNSREKK